MRIFHNNAIAHASTRLYLIYITHALMSGCVDNPHKYQSIEAVRTVIQRTHKQIKGNHISAIKQPVAGMFTEDRSRTMWTRDVCVYVYTYIAFCGRESDRLAANYIVLNVELVTYHGVRSLASTRVVSLFIRVHRWPPAHVACDISLALV